MDNHRDNVVTLPDRGRADGKQPSRPEVLRAAVGHLDELSRRLEQLSPHVTWSAQRWMIASTPFRMRLVGVRKRLDELTAFRPVSGQADVYWFLELEGASLEAERRIHDIDACLRTLHHADTSPSVRARETEIFTSRRSELAEAAMRIRNLLFQRFPELAGRR
ncbi:MAG: hypothetical protein ACLPKI_16535 [Streptosporangiaceae bacterium]